MNRPAHCPQPNHERDSEYHVHAPKGFSLKEGGYEYNFAILVMCAAVFLMGGGGLALDRFFWRRKQKP